MRPKGHTGRCVCFHCWSQGVEYWFRGLRLCSMCHSAIRGVLVKSLPYGPMHWGCYRYRKPPSHSFELLPEYHSSVEREGFFQSMWGKSVPEQMSRQLKTNCGRIFGGILADPTISRSCILALADPTLYRPCRPRDLQTFVRSCMCRLSAY